MPRTTAEARAAQELIKREKIRAALREMLAERPLDEITMAQIAGRVGISSVTLYKYYSSRDSLVGETFRLSRHEALEKVKKVMNAPGDPVQRLLDGLRCLYDFGDGDYTLFTAYIQSIRINDEFHENVKKGGKDLIETFSAPIRDGIKMGIFRKVDPCAAALVIFESAMGLQHFALFTKHPFNPAEAISALQSVILDGLIIKQ